MRQSWWRRALRQESVSPLLVYVVGVQLPRRIGKNSTTNPSRLALLCLCAFLSFFFSALALFWVGSWDPCHTSLPCKLGSYPSCLYLTELCSTCLAPLFLFFLVEYWLLVFQGLPLLLLPTLLRHGLVRSLGHLSVMSCKMRLGLCGFFLIELCPV